MGTGNQSIGLFVGGALTQKGGWGGETVARDSSFHQSPDKKEKIARRTLLLTGDRKKNDKKRTFPETLKNGGSGMAGCAFLLLLPVGERKKRQKRKYFDVGESKKEWEVVTSFGAGARGLRVP